ncbi:SRPBCC domain-containing protein [Brachybacterium muris]|uniref:SRPBCC domain-containing protein n=1 Tax=Brachybacterium muris TaxID=219301 RepID=UPI0030B85520
MQCHHFDAGECRSCTLLAIPRQQQLADGQARVQELLAPYVTTVDPADEPAEHAAHADMNASGGSGVWLEPVVGPEAGFRSRGKMAVAGTAAAPVLGLPGQPNTADLSDCPLYPPGVEAVLLGVRALIRRAQVPPYDVARRRGEIKNVLITASPDGEHQVRLVLRSEKALPRIREHLPRLLEAHPSVVGVSANIHPAHTTAVEGEVEIPLAGSSTIAVRTGDVTLQARPQSFLQTNTEVAGQLYRQAAAWIAGSSPTTVWDLYCGLGGFALHVAKALPTAQVTGVESSAQAIEGAREAAAAEGLDVRFLAEDATAWARRQSTPEGARATGGSAASVSGSPAGAPVVTSPDVAIVNPPRRGIGADLADWLETSPVPEVVYSSCNPATLATDLAAMPSLRIVAARYVDMFPHTEHAEVIVHLRRTHPLPAQQTPMEAPMLATPDSQLTDVTRKVERSDRITGAGATPDAAPGPGTATAGGWVVSLAQDVTASPEDVWAALTDPARIALYFGEVTGELREGGEYSIPMMGSSGPVLRVVQPELIALGWGGEGSASRLELRIAPSADGTGSRFELRHLVPADEQWDTFGPAATGCGWDGALLGLARHLQQPATAWTTEMAGFETSTEGREFVTATSELWQQAHLAAGADPQHAHEVAARTAAFYRGEDPGAPAVGDDPSPASDGISTDRISTDRISTGPEGSRE